MLIISLLFNCLFRSFSASTMSSRNLPKLVVFDLDYTLWPFWVDTHVKPPFQRKGYQIVDSLGAKVNCYPQANEVLKTLHEMECDMAVASRTSEIEGAHQLIKLFDWDKYFKYKEIYPGCKVAHFQQFKKNSNIDYEDMLFFDDENRNIVDLSKLNVTAILVDNGMDMKLLNEGLNRHARKLS